MIQLFRSLLGGSSREVPVKRFTANVRPKTGAAAGDYRAVSLTAALRCEAVTKDMAGRRFLLREAPVLPLTGCTMGSKCSCKYRKHADRRDGDRRLLGDTETSRWFAGSERRARRARRLIKA
jgi:hypothetical protein